MINTQDSYCEHTMYFKANKSIQICKYGKTPSSLKITCPKSRAEEITKSALVLTNHQMTWFCIEKETRALVKYVK